MIDMEKLMREQLASRESEYFVKNISRNQLDRCIYGLLQEIRYAADDDSLSAKRIIYRSHKLMNFKYNKTQPRRLANLLAVRGVLATSNSKRAASIVSSVDEQLLGELLPTQ